jgi:hypothetical protein
MPRLYADGKAKILTTVVSESWTDHVKIPRGMEVNWLVNEHCDTLVIEGHVDLAEASNAMDVVGGPGFSAPRHTWMRFMSVPDGELNESDDRYGSLGECQRGAKGAEPVTISVRNT